VLWVDTDNALGSPSGDGDDALAIAALLTSGASIAGLSSCAGNTSAELAYANNVRLAQRLGWRGPVMRKPDLRDFRGRIVALGPLTNVASARAAAEIIMVGGNSATRGRWPPLWPYEFNLTKDRRAALSVFHSDVPLTIFPLNVARRLTIRVFDVPTFLREDTKRWFAHLRRTRLTRDFPVYDLAAALYALSPEGFTMQRTTVEMRLNTLLRFGRGTREVTLCTALDRDVLWRRFVATKF
jgi:inosine-uridine nucleoside N-ribohydrolase